MIKDLTRGIIKENPTFGLMLGLCPTLAVTTEAINGIGMGLATAFVLVFSNIFVSLLRNIIPKNVRIPAYIVIIATFVTITDLLLKAYVPALYKALGIFIPLIVVNCIILGRAEGFANKNPVLNSLLDAVGMGIGFTLSLTLLASIREVLGAGTLTFELLGMGKKFFLFGADSYINPAVIMILPPGAFITIGILFALKNYFEKKAKTE